jgi:hypothetical protein
MRNNVVAVIVDGVWQQFPANDGRHAAVDTRDSSYEVDRIVTVLSELVLRAQSMSEKDQRRVRDFVAAAQSMLSATTCLPKSEQQLFEAALRDAAAARR